MRWMTTMAVLASVACGSPDPETTGDDDDDASSDRVDWLEVCRQSLSCDDATDTSPEECAELMGDAMRQAIRQGCGQDLQAYGRCLEGATWECVRGTAALPTECEVAARRYTECMSHTEYTDYDYEYTDYEYTDDEYTDTGTHWATAHTGDSAGDSAADSAGNTGDTGP